MENNKSMPMAYFLLEIPTIERLQQFKANRWINKVQTQIKRYFVSKWWGKDEYLYKMKNSQNPLISFRLQDQRGKGKEHSNYYLSTTKIDNFSGVEILASTKNDAVIYAMGNPHQLQFFGNVTPITNPLYNNRNDGFVFAISNNWQQIEVFIFENGKDFQTENAKMVQSGIIDVSEIRAKAKYIYPFNQND